MLPTSVSWDRGANRSILVLPVDTSPAGRGLQDVLCLVVDEATRLAYFVFSRNGSARLS